MTEAQYYDLYGTYEGYEGSVPCPRCRWAKPNYYKGILWGYTVNSNCQCWLLYPTLLELVEVETEEPQPDYDPDLPF